MSEITRAEFEAFRHDITSRLDRMESKLDESMKCQYQMIRREECSEAKEKLWRAIDALKRYVWIGVGVAIASSVFIPLIFALARR